MIILPFNIGFIGIEPDYLFNSNFNAYSEYIKSSAEIKNDNLFINVPTIETDYKYNFAEYNIGAWMLTQIKLKNAGFLPIDRINKLRNIEVVKNVYAEDGKTLLQSYVTTFNTFDTDSTIDEERELWSNITNDTYLLRFDDDGLLNENGNNIIYAINDSSLGNNLSCSVDIIDCGSNLNSELNCDINKVVLFENSILTFKDNKLCTDRKMQVINNDIINVDIRKTKDYTLDGIKSISDGNNLKIAIFNNGIKERPYMNIDNFNRTICEENLDNKDFANLITKQLDFSYQNQELFDNNYNNSLNTILDYDLSLLNNIYKSKVYCDYCTGKELNNLLSVINNKQYMIVPRMSYENHQSYCIVFVNGVIIDTYSEAIVTPDEMYIPIYREFKDNDTIEFMHFLNCNNNELQFKYSKDAVKYKKFISDEDLKLFSTNIDDDLFTYKFDYNADEISFNINGIEDNLIGKDVIAVSKNKFVYERLVVDQKSYKIRLGKQFRYCDNQNQYYLFINGRRILDDSFLITIPKITRPFDHMYIYTSKFVNPNDRIELFYLPFELSNINKDETIQLSRDGYIKFDRTKLDIPVDPRYYLFFINGKKIPNNKLLPVGDNKLRILEDTKSLNTLVISTTYEESIDEVKTRLHRNTKSVMENIIDNILSMNTSNKYDKLDYFLGKAIGIYMSDSEDNALVRYVGKIAILNEIVRDFWVTNGYEYEASSFLYDYYTDEFIVRTSEDGNDILPSMDGTIENINIIKSPLHYLYFSFMDNMPEYFEYGYQINNPIINWEYEMPYGDEEELQWQRINNEDIDTSIRQYQISDIITSDTTYHIEASDGIDTCEYSLDIKFANGIYYGLVDEDTLDKKDSDVYTNNPQKLISDLNKRVKPNRDLSLINYKFGNNKYFIYAAPKRLVYDSDGKSMITFYNPDIKSVKMRDDKTIPKFTNGLLDDTKSLISLDEFKMEYFTECDFINKYGYSEKYVIFKSNGFFTRLYEDTKFELYVK